MSPLLYQEYCCEMMLFLLICEPICPPGAVWNGLVDVRRARDHNNVECGIRSEGLVSVSCYLSDVESLR